MKPGARGAGDRTRLPAPEARPRHIPGMRARGGAGLLLADRCCREQHAWEAPSSLPALVPELTVQVGLTESQHPLLRRFQPIPSVWVSSRVCPSCQGQNAKEGDGLAQSEALKHHHSP